MAESVRTAVVISYMQSLSFGKWVRVREFSCSFNN